MTSVFKLNCRKLATMEDQFSKEYLEGCSYRLLQQIAKSLSLPSNVKKIYLQQLIYTKKHCSHAEVEELVNQVRLERRLRTNQANKAANKKRHLKSISETSTRDSHSPPITHTPKRSGHILIGYSSNSSPIKIPQHIPMAPSRFSLNSSDRILRSFNRIRKPFFMNNSLPISSVNEENKVNIIVTKEEKYRRVNRTYVRKTGDLLWRDDAMVMPVSSITRIPKEHSRQVMNINISPAPIRRQRRPSGIYPLKPEYPVQISNIAIRKTDGTTSKLNAIIQKSLSQIYNFELNAVKNRLVNLIDKETQTTPDRQETNHLQPIAIMDTPQSNISNSSSEIDLLNNNSNEFTVFGDKGKNEQVKANDQEVSKTMNEYQLPRINEVFSQFSTMYRKDYSQPIYVQVDNEPEFGQSYQYLPDPRVQYQGTSLLEKVYNIKNVNTQQLPVIHSTATTMTVFSTPVIATAKTQPTAEEGNMYNNTAPLRDNQINQAFYEMVEPRVHEFLRNYHCEDDTTNTTLHEATTFGVRRSTSSIQTLASQELGANVTIPEMVEDALEIISQDGDYMERTGMDVRMQCILCNWAGPKIILEYHIRKNHAPDVIECENGEICAKYSLGSLSCRPLWLCQVLEYRGTLYVLSAKYEDPDCFMATLSTLSPDTETIQSGRMTIYNKVSGEPFTWEGSIRQLPPSMPYENDTNCFKLELSRMDLLPNSANLKLLNRELVMLSPNKVIVGAPELDNIHICLIVKILD